MKLQYLGDSKDSFKWDYHDFLARGLGYSKFTIALMMTPDDDDGIWRRLQMIPFNRRFSESERDPDLYEKLLLELPGILNWALDGYAI